MHGTRDYVRTVVMGVVLAALLVPMLPGVAHAEVCKYSCDDPAKVYYGNPRLFRRPCQISADRVYRHIPEYREILEKGLNDRDVRYHFLLKKASERFAKAVRATARALRHDLVAEAGTVTALKEDTPAPPDRTDEVIANIG